MRAGDDEYAVSVVSAGCQCCVGDHQCHSVDCDLSACRAGFKKAFSPKIKELFYKATEGMVCPLWLLQSAISPSLQKQKCTDKIGG